MPIPDTEMPTEQVQIRLPHSLSARLAAHFGTLEAAIPNLGRLAWAQWQSRQIAAPTGPALTALSAHNGPINAAEPFQGRPEQAGFYAAITEALTQTQPIVLAEGGTGLGKGRVIAALAAQYRDEGVIVAAPTIQILGQLLIEWHQLSGAHADCYLGLDAFISTHRLREWIDEATMASADLQAEAQAVADWIAQGAGCTRPATRAFHNSDPSISYLYEDLVAIAPRCAATNVRLTRTLLAIDSPETPDDGARAYQALRARVSDSERVVFASHAALVWNARSQGALLPERPYLILDEAHLLAGVAEATFTRSVAMRELLWHLRDEALWQQTKGVTAARKAHADLETLMDRLTASRPLLETHGAVRDEAQARSLLKNYAKALLDALEPLLKKCPDEGAEAILEAAAMARAILADQTRATLSYSPAYGYPTLTSGPRSLRLFFNQFWERLEAAVLVSATLYLPTMHGQPSHGYLQGSLHLPAERIVPLPPVAPNWLYQVPLYHPAQATDLEAFRPPQARDYDQATADFQTAVERWHDVLAEQLRTIHSTAAGGILVLLTSYDSITALAERLHPYLGADLMTQARSGFRTAHAHYIRRFTDGGRPLWLASGPAWTGTDLSAATCIDSTLPADKDFLLTDLVIPRVPFGTERSSVHQARMTYLVTAERDRAAFQLRQGLGRLIRRPGLPQRRIWMLDARLWRPKGSSWLYGPFSHILKRYPLHPLTA
ncbi:helicase C-terminal domain-containing protein [Thiorhodovibrio winogradskyi]|nr:helicase C-terminal domain-containing protein [Thiorhodovibrio winogradskyi]